MASRMYRLNRCLFLLFSLLGLPQALFAWEHSSCASPAATRQTLSYAQAQYKMEELAKAHFANGNDKEVEEELTRADVRAKYGEEYFQYWKALQNIIAGKINTQSACAFLNIRTKLIKDHHKFTPEKWGINQAEFMSVYHYTTNEYMVINPALRSKTETLNLIVPIIQNLDSALSKLPSFKGVVYRGVNLSNEVGAKIKVGAEFSDAAYLSTSIDKPYPGHYQFVIHSRTGREVFHFSPNPEETEVLFPRDTKFKITKISARQSEIRVEMMEIDSGNGR